MTTHPQEPLRVPTRLGRLHVRAVGSGPATVLWPSMFVDGRTFDPLLPLLPGRRLIVVDGPGLGASEPLRRRSSIVEAADAALDLLTGSEAAALGIDGPVDWVGNAFGGHVGYELARRPGVLRSLVAVSAPTEPVPAALRRQIGVLGPLLRVLGPVGPVRGAILTALLTEASAADPGIRAAVLASVATPSRRSLALALRSFIVDRVDVTAGLPEIRVPCLFVAGDDRGDWTPEAAAAAAALTPSASAVTVHGSRTLVPLEQPEALARELLAFWSRL
jgi:pimeloyl-ACP methyl ester carboxylesterase